MGRGPQEAIGGSPLSALTRLSMSLDRSLAQRFERLVQASQYTNRSEFIRDLIRQRLVEQEWADEQHEVIGTISLVYDHQARQLADRLVEIQHGHHACVLATTHVHLSHQHCAEMIMVRGTAPRIRSLVDQLRQQRGVLHAGLTLSSTGERLR
jgi:CopG family nickel-responsive transcriptional regulator